MLQIFLGALVAGLDAGLAFNDWPLMDGAIIPSGLMTLEPAWLNGFENPKAVQFIHRIWAYMVLVLLIAQMIGVLVTRHNRQHVILPIILVLAGLIQAAIGIVTLVLQVPIFWALLHQGSAIILLGLAVIHWRVVKGSYSAR